MKVNTLPEQSKAAYIAFDVDRIKEFVFAGTRPLDATGASEMVKALDKTEKLQEWIARFPSHKILYACGGSGMIRIEDGSQAEAMSKEIELRFRCHTITGSCSAVSVDVPEAGRFQDAIRDLGIKLQRRKAEKALWESPEAWTFGSDCRCAACGIFPSAVQDKLEEWLCNSCYCKRRAGRDEKLQNRMAIEAEQIAGKSNGNQNKYLACLYADVDNAGGLLQMCESEDQVVKLSAHLFKAVEKGREIIAKRWPRRYQSPIVGGDDLVVFFPTDECVDLTAQVWNQVERAIKEIPPALEPTKVGKELKNRVSLSMGLLTADHKLPIPFIFEMATMLLKSAKLRSYEEEKSCIDFMMLKGGSPLSDSIKASRELYLHRDLGMRVENIPDPGDESKLKQVRFVRLTARPYTSTEFAELKSSSGSIGDDNKGQLKSIAELFETASPMEIYIYLQYQRSRIPALCSNPLQRYYHLGIVKDDLGVVTSVPDMLEIIEMAKLK